ELHRPARPQPPGPEVPGVHRRGTGPHRGARRARHGPEPLTRTPHTTAGRNRRTRLDVHPIDGDRIRRFRVAGTTDHRVEDREASIDGVTQAPAEGRRVTAVVRDRARLTVPDQEGLSVTIAGFGDAEAPAGAVGGADA